MPQVPSHPDLPWPRLPQSVRLLTAGTLIWIGAVVSSAQPARPSLQDGGILSSEIRSRQPASTGDEVLDGLIGQLASSDFTERHTASAALRKLNADQLTRLAQTINADSDPEYAQRILSAASDRIATAPQDAGPLIEFFEQAATESPPGIAGGFSRRVFRIHWRERLEYALQKLADSGAVINGRLNDVPDGGRMWLMRSVEDGLQIRINRHWKGNEEAIRLLGRISEVAGPGPGQLGVFLIDGHPLTEADVRLVKELAGEHRVSDRPEILLGITSPSGPLGNGIQITNVKEKSSAHNAGLRPGDIILEMDGERLTEFQDLVDRLREYNVGDTVPMRIYRPNRYFRPEFGGPPPDVPEGSLPQNGLLNIPVKLQTWPPADPPYRRSQANSPPAAS